MKTKVAVDTNVLLRANAPITTEKQGREFALRLKLLSRFQDKEIFPLWSPQLAAEWATHVKEPRNDYIRAFFELMVDTSDGFNYATPWGGSEKQRMSKCRFPKHDLHLLRTAYLKVRTSHIVTEEGPVLGTATCVKHEFDVHIKNIDETI